MDGRRDRRQGRRASEHGVKHRLRETTRERVLLTRMERAQDRDRPVRGSGCDLDSVTEARSWPDPELPAQRFVSELTKHDRDTNTGEGDKFAPQERNAPVTLVRTRSIFRRCTAHHCAHVRVPQREAVVSGDTRGSVSEPSAVHRPEQPVPRAIAGEQPAGAIGTVRRGSEPEHDHRRRRVPEPGHPPTPVGRVPERHSLLDGDLFAPRDQPGACPTRGDLPSDQGQFGTAPFDGTVERVRCSWHALIFSRSTDPAAIAGSALHHRSTGTGSVTAMAKKPTMPPTTRVILVRHGQTPTTGIKLPGRAKGLHLAEVGRAQAAAVAAQLDAVAKIDAIYSSPLERARETAMPLAKRRGMPIRIERGLLECDFGEWTGANLKDLYKLPEWNTVQRYPSGFRFPGGESFSEMQTRIVSALQKFCVVHPGGVVVAYSHADPIKAGVADALGTHLDLFQRISISTCSVTAISYSAAGPSVLTVNTVGDLSKLAPS